ncbi:hypothetical protein SEA_BARTHOLOMEWSD_71 [Streptomyces phage BartholomewSD]|uniref:Uncharacterized protein n=1 Tax=Streptomyces phage Alvy TaxID=2599888 RepID=A0A5J6TNT0_9CAUD|nr:hypothetical protein KGG89_gp23 [Streptomyces phage Alvy]QAX95520.1 hypothetical protein SEA_BARTHOLOMEWSD_71 [Streptomyces phage BartholomewSD]QFG12480.1 hypothetical protein SEA_ALVY_71 [Streptomyces phage Alvy]
MKKSLLFAPLLAGLLVLVTPHSLASASPATPEPVAYSAKLDRAPSLPTRPCADDSDDRNCFWDAGQRGNRKGYSYWVDRAGKVTYLNPKLNDPKKRAAWKAKNRALKREYWGTVWGHRLCWAKVGDTSYIYCFDGFRETS